MLKEKLESITEHLSNVHLFPENVEHKQCAHDPLDGERTKAWLDPESLVSLSFLGQSYSNPILFI